MKNLLLAICLISIIACNTKELHPDYAVISGKIINAKSEAVTIFGMGGSKKLIPLQENGVFKDTMKVSKGSTKFQLMLMQDSKMSSIYIENGVDISINADANDFKNTLHFDLDLADYNNFLNKKSKIMSSESSFKKSWYRENRTEFNKRAANLKNELEQALNSYTNISEKNIQTEMSYIDSYIKRFTKKYDVENSFAVKLAGGKTSPTFENYENFDGSTTSLSDFKGKYLYIDVWATWCAPCKAQIPYLEEIEKEYHSKNIVFVSMSVDKQEDKQKWRAMVKEKQMSGIQILAPDATNSDFTRAYNITSIPRFIIIDTEGKIIDYNAPRPSDKKQLKTLFSSLDI